MLSYKFNGGLCNTIIQSFALFFYCKERSINYGNIVLNKYYDRYYRNSDGKMISEKPIIKDIDFFDNIKYCFCETVERYNEITQDYQKIHFRPQDRFTYPTNNVVFTGCNFVSPHTIKLNKELFIDMFYNSKIMNFVKEKNSDIVKQPFTAVHCRRGDFVFCEYSKYVISDERLVSIIESGENIVIFSDQIDYYENKFSKYDNVKFSKNNGFEDLYLMSLSSKLYTTSYSTFSVIAKVCKEIFPKV